MRVSDRGGSLGRMSVAVREALVEKNRSQRWLAEKVGITEKHLSQMLTGKIEGSFTVWDAVLFELGLALVVVARDAQGWPLG